MELGVESSDHRGDQPFLEQGGSERRTPAAVAQRSLRACGREMGGGESDGGEGILILLYRSLVTGEEGLRGNRNMTEGVVFV
jgi:hypothetical protein